MEGAAMSEIPSTAGKQPTLDELLEKARHHVMTDEEKEAQRQSWVRGEMGISEAERAEGRCTTRLPAAAGAASTETAIEDTATRLYYARFNHTQKNNYMDAIHPKGSNWLDRKIVDYGVAAITKATASLQAHYDAAIANWNVVIVERNKLQAQVASLTQEIAELKERDIGRLESIKTRDWNLEVAKRDAVRERAMAVEGFTKWRRVKQILKTKQHQLVMARSRANQAEAALAAEQKRSRELLEAAQGSTGTSDTRKEG
jgi:hypothetical protein